MTELRAILCPLCNAGHVTDAGTSQGLLCNVTHPSVSETSSREPDCTKRQSERANLDISSQRKKYLLSSQVQDAQEHCCQAISHLIKAELGGPRPSKSK